MAVVATSNGNFHASISGTNTQLLNIATGSIHLLTTPGANSSALTAEAGYGGTFIIQVTQSTNKHVSEVQVTGKTVADTSSTPVGYDIYQSAWRNIGAAS